MSIGVRSIIFLALFVIEGLGEKYIAAWREKNKMRSKSDDK